VAARPPARWAARDMRSACRELEHPADLLLEIRGPDLPALFAHALFGLFQATVELGLVEARGTRRVGSSGTTVADALRGLLAEALYVFATEHFLVATADVTVRGFAAGPEGGAGEVAAVLWGEPYEPGRHRLLTEVKAVTYHRLQVSHPADGWVATVLLDV
jgi:SHS2 domain-containing protein